MEYLRDILQASVEKNGEIPLTNKHLLNIVSMAIRKQEREEDSDLMGTIGDIY